jgi:hypothetical protein
MDKVEIAMDVEQPKLEPRELSIDDLDDAAGGLNWFIPVNWVIGTLICRQ